MSRALYDILLGLLRASRRGQTPPTLLFIGFDRALNVEPEQKEGNVIRGNEARERIGKIGSNFYAVPCEKHFLNIRFLST